MKDWIKRVMKRLFVLVFSPLPKDVLRAMNLPDYKPSYNEDGLYTNHNCDFLKDARFQEAYARFIDTGSSQGWDMRWRLHTLLWAASVSQHVEGDFVECGTYLGGSARAIVDYVDFNRLGKDFFLVDSFQGLSEEHRHLHDYKEGDYFDRVRSLFVDHPRVKLVKGFVPDVLNTRTFGPVSLLHIDMGVAEAEVAALRFFWSRLSKGAIVVLSYYAYPVRNWKEIKAGYDAFAREQGVEICYCPTGQGLIVKVQEPATSRLLKGEKGMTSNPVISLDPELNAMLEAYRVSDPTFASSRYWEVLSRKNVEQLDTEGFENFKQTVAMNYFTFLVKVRDPYMQFLIQSLPAIEVAGALWRALLSRKHRAFSSRQSKVFNFATYLLWAYIRQQGCAEWMDKVWEPVLGNPPSVRVKGREISQDLAHSVLEYRSVSSGVPELRTLGTVAELGAGYGRTAQVFMRLLPATRYVVVDIPPALYISQRYLSSIFPERKIFKFRSFTRFEDVADEFNMCQIAFLLPAQIDLLPKKSIDLFMAIDSLHEMQLEQIRNYFSRIEAVTRKYFYFKCWKKTKIPYDNVIISEEDYPVKPEWRKIFWRDCDVLNLPTLFGREHVSITYFEALMDLETNPMPVSGTTQSRQWADRENHRILHREAVSVARCGEAQQWKERGSL